MSDRSVPIETLPATAGVPVWIGSDSRARRRTSALDNAWPFLRAGIDLVSLVMALTVASAAVPLGLTAPWALGTVALTLIAFGAGDLYAPRTRLAVVHELRRAVTLLALVTLLVGAVALLVSDHERLGDAAVVHWLVASVLIAAGRGALYGAQRARTARLGGSPTLIVGAGEVGRRMARRLDEDWSLGLTPVGFLDKEPLEHVRGDLPLPVLGASWDLEGVVAEQGVETVVFAFSTAPVSVMVDLIRRCWALGVDVRVVPRLFEVEGRRVSTDHVGALPLVGLRTSDPRGWQFEVKYALDRVFASFALALLAPPLALIAIAVLFSTGRPILFRQRRVGRDGRTFDMFKFRTMRGTPDAVGEADEHWAQMILAGTAIDPESVLDPRAGDDRRTRVGATLRKFSLDELPQLWNVARGDMSLIGPRPERTHYVARFEHAIHRYPDRHRVKSGVTGWAQVHGLRGETSLEDRIEWDNFYIENWTPWLDLKIVLKTFMVLLSRNGS